MNPLILLIPECVSGGAREESSRDREERVLRQLDRKIEGVSRPRLVLDCSRLRVLAMPDIHLLVGCLERIMKRNGDVRLSGLSPDALESLSQSGVDRLFRIFPSADEAARSFGPHLNVISSSDSHSNGLPRAYPVDETAVSSGSSRWAGIRESGDTNERSEKQQDRLH